MNILIIKLGAIGDVLRTTCILPALKDRYKNSAIIWATKSQSKDILKNNRLIDEIYVVDKIENVKIQKYFYDLVISLDDELNACKLASSVKSNKIIGTYLKNNIIVYTNDSALWFDMGLVSKYGKEKADILKNKNKKTYQEILFRILGLDFKNYAKYEPILVLTEKEIEFGRKFAAKSSLKNKIVIGINTGAGLRWEDKKLSIEDTADLIDRIKKNLNADILLFGGPEERERNNKIIKLCNANIIDAGCNNTLMEFASLINLCNVIISSDSLAMHIGIALKKYVVAFFCPTSSNEIELYNRGVKIIPEKGCLCCYKPKCDIAPVWDLDKMVNAVIRFV